MPSFKKSLIVEQFQRNYLNDALLSDLLIGLLRSHDNESMSSSSEE